MNRRFKPAVLLLSGALAATLLAQTLHAQSVSRRRIPGISAQDAALHELLVQAKAAADKQDYATAEAAYLKYLAQKPNDAPAHFDLGFVYTAQHRKDNAEAEYRKAIALDPKMTEAYLNLGVSLLADDPKTALEPLEQVTKLNYSYAKGHYLLGAARERSGELQKAIEEYNVAEKLDPNDFETHLALGHALLYYTNSLLPLAAAESEFREALKLKGDNAEAEMGLAQSLAAQKKNADAATALGNYLNEKPNDMKARMMRASLLVDMDKDDEALEELDRVAKDQAETPDGLKLRSLIYYREKKYDQTAAVLQKAEALAPQDAEIRARLGHVLLQLKNYPAATRELNEAFRLDTTATETLRDLVAAEYLSEDYPATLAAMNVLEQRETPKPGAWFVRATCYDHMGQAAAALEAYQKFLALNTDKNSNQYFEAAARVRFLEKELKDKGK
ncbi:MAG TPA: tetratricopeptide repeat protein [Candidatus Acidoferrales bacterium]|nr:tetratricopeptide repeat protein [Candidatus Acidoferrales bacterium]